MQAVFEVKTIEADWKPPFQKKIENKEYSVKEGEPFDKIVGNGNNDSVFRLVWVAPDKVLVEYSRFFTVKGYENPQSRQMWVDREGEQTLSYLWGEKGITKKIKLVRIVFTGKPESTSNPENGS